MTATIKAEVVKEGAMLVVSINGIKLLSLCEPYPVRTEAWAYLEVKDQAK